MKDTNKTDATPFLSSQEPEMTTRKGRRRNRVGKGGFDGFVILFFTAIHISMNELQGNKHYESIGRNNWQAGKSKS